VVIDDFDLKGMAAFKTEAHAPLVIDADTSLTCTLALQGFKAIGWWILQVFGSRGVVQMSQAQQCSRQDISRQPPRPFRKEQLFGFLVGEAADHGGIVNTLFTACKAVRHV